MIQPRCPQCRSSLVIVLEHQGLSFIQCRECHYDELEEAIVPETRKTTREKGRYSIYKVGGKSRTLKKA